LKVCLEKGKKMIEFSGAPAIDVPNAMWIEKSLVKNVLHIICHLLFVRLFFL